MIRSTVDRRIDISPKTVFLIAGFLGLLWIVYLIKDLILLLFVAVIFTSAFSPIIDFFVGMKLPRPLSIALVYVMVFLLVGLILTAGITPITTQTSSLFLRLSDSLNNGARSNPVLSQFRLQDQLPNLSHNLFTITLDIFQILVQAILVGAITFYVLLDKDKLEDRFAHLFPENRARIRRLIKQIEVKLGAWLRGQVVLSFIIAVIVYVFLTALRVEFALPLAIISGLMEVVPIVGPLLGSVPGIAVALAQSPLLALIVAIFYFLTQQLESHIIVPQLMRRAVGLNPLLVIIAIAVGGRLLGIAGAFLAVPIAVVVQIIGDDYLTGKELDKKELRK